MYINLSLLYISHVHLISVCLYIYSYDTYIRNVQRSMRLFSTFLMYTSSHTSFLQEISINLFLIDVDPCTSLMTYTSLMYIDVHVLCTYLKGVHILRASHTSCVHVMSISLKRQRIRVLQHTCRLPTIPYVYMYMQICKKRPM